MVYALLWVGVAHQWAWIDRIDQVALDAFYDVGVGRPGWVAGWDLYCTILGPGAFRIATAVAIVVAFVQRRVALAVFLILTIELSGAVTEVAKSLAARPRPDTAFVDALSSSFPSGHALGVMAAVLAVLAVVAPRVPQHRRGWLIALGVVVVVTIGLGRVVLNVHHPSDVVAGWALGYAYFVFCVLVAPPRRTTPEAAGTPAAPGSSR